MTLFDIQEFGRQHGIGIGRDRDVHRGAFARCTVEPEYPIQDIHALFDTDQAERAAAPAPLRHADAVVADAHGNPAPFDAQFNADLARLGMPRNIAERFLQDAEQGGGALLAHAHFAVRFDQLALGARAAAELLDLPLNRGTQAKVEYARPQVVG